MRVAKLDPTGLCVGIASLNTAVVPDDSILLPDDAVNPIGMRFTGGVFVAVAPPAPPLPSKDCQLAMTLTSTDAALLTELEKTQMQQLILKVMLKGGRL